MVEEKVMEASVGSGSDVEELGSESEPSEVSEDGEELSIADESRFVESSARESTATRRKM